MKKGRLILFVSTESPSDPDLACICHATVASKASEIKKLIDFCKFNGAYFTRMRLRANINFVPEQR